MEEEAQEECSEWIAKSNNYPPSTALAAYLDRYRVHDPEDDKYLKQVSKDRLKAILKQRACDNYYRNVRRNMDAQNDNLNKEDILKIMKHRATDILQKIHYYIDYAVDRGWRYNLWMKTLDGKIITPEDD